MFFTKNSISLQILLIITMFNKYVHKLYEIHISFSVLQQILH